MNSVKINNNCYFSDNYIEFERINVLFGDNGTYRSQFINELIHHRLGYVEDNSMVIDVEDNSMVIDVEDNSMVIDVYENYSNYYRIIDFDSGFDLEESSHDEEQLDLFKKLFPKYKDIEHYQLDDGICKLIDIIGLFDRIKTPNIFLKNLTTNISYLNMSTIMEQMLKWIYEDDRRKIFIDSCDPDFIDKVNLNEILLFVRNDENKKIDIGKFSDSELVKCQAGVFTPGEIASGEDHRKIMDDIMGKKYTEFMV